MLNQCQFIGNLGRDPEIRTFGNGNKVCNLRLAVSEHWKDRETGERKEKTQWISLAIFQEGLVRVAEQYLKKGSKIYVQGKMATRKWQDQSGNDRYSTEVVLQGFGSTLVMLDGKQAGSNQNQGYDEPREGGEGYSSGSAGRDIDDEIPF